MVFAWAFILVQNVFAIKVHHFNTYKQIIPLLPKTISSYKHPLIVIDIDNTILHNTNPIGSPEWFEWQASCIKNKQACRDADSFRQMAKVNDYWLSHHSLDLVSKEVKDFYQLLLDKNYQWMILSARSANLMAATQKNMLKHHIFYDKPSYSSLTSWQAGVNGEIVYNKGYLLATGGNKAKTLMMALDKLDFHPDVVVVIDDDQSNIRHYLASLKQFNTDLFVFRYTKYDDQYNDFFSNDSRKAKAHKDFFDTKAKLKALESYSSLPDRKDGK
jgi:hypothetical protein